MPVEVGDRRHVILEGADTHAGAESARTRRYFGPYLRTDIRDIAALLFTLDLSTFRPRALPQTDAKQYQMVQSMSSTRPVQAFLHCCLQTGKFVFTEKETDRYGEPIETQCGRVTDGKLRMSKKSTCTKRFSTFAGIVSKCRGAPCSGNSSGTSPSSLT